MTDDQFSSDQREVLRSTMHQQLDMLRAETPSHWTFLSHGREVSVRAEQGWLRLASPLPRRRQGLPGPCRAHALLASNACLPEGMSYGIGRRSRAVCLVADVPLHTYGAHLDEMAGEVELVLESFQAALQESPVRTETEWQQTWARLGDPLTVDDEAGAATRELCQSAGWEYHERGTGQLVMTLDVPDHFCQVQAYQADGGPFRLGTPLDAPPRPSADSRYAMATFLLTASRVVRLARATVAAGNRDCAYRWEVCWEKLPTVPQFHCGMSALSIACRLTSRELPALSDNVIANAYIRLRAAGSH